MLAGDVAASLGVSVQALHYYEREGLIPPPPRSGAGYRLYTPELVERLHFIRKAQALGFSLDEAREIVTLADGGATPCEHVRRAVEAKLRDVDRRLSELRSLRRELVALAARCADAATTGAVARVCAVVEQAPTPLVTPGARTGARTGARRRPSVRR